jgi:hypothetical protein
MSKATDEKFSAEETRKRMHAALRGARIAGHKPMERLDRKGGKMQQAKGMDKKRKK